MTYDAERLRELLLRLVGPGPKASYVSASETHEIADGCIELLDELDDRRRKTASRVGVGDGSGELFVYGDCASTQAAAEKFFELERLRRFRDALLALASIEEALLSADFFRAWDAAIDAERAALAKENG